jgi:hypothetical protein
MPHYVARCSIRKYDVASWRRVVDDHDEDLEDASMLNLNEAESGESAIDRATLREMPMRHTTLLGRVLPRPPYLRAQALPIGPAGLWLRLEAG